MTAELERQRFGDTLPVHWWDQPHVGQNSRPYEALVDAAAAEVTRLSKESHESVDLLANSFGAYLARVLVARVPDRVGAIVICGGVWDLSTGILRLATRFSERSGDGDLQEACQRAVQTETPEGFMALLARVAAIPGFLDCYWSAAAEEQRKAMQSLAEEGRLVDWATCQSVMTAALGVPQVSLASPHPGGVRILLGRFDPYFDDSDIPAWKALWPGADIEVVDAGHFPHLELPPTVWMPRATANLRGSSNTRA